MTSTIDPPAVALLIAAIFVVILALGVGFSIARRGADKNPDKHTAAVVKGSAVALAIGVGGILVTLFVVPTVLGM